MRFNFLVLLVVALVGAVCVTQTQAFKPASRLLPIKRNHDMDTVLLEADSDSLLTSAEDIARQLGAEVTALNGESEALAEESAPTAQEIPELHHAHHAMVESTASASTATSAQTEKLVQEEMERADYREFLPNHVASLIENVEDQMKAPVPELNLPELQNTAENVENAIFLETTRPRLQVVKNDQHEYAQLDVQKGGFSQRHINKAKGVDVYIVNNYDNEALNEVRPVAPPHPKIYPPYNRRIVPHSPPRPDENKVNPVTHLNTLSVYEASLEGPEFEHPSFQAPPGSAAAAFLALEAHAPKVASAGQNLQFDSNGNWLPPGSRPPNVADMYPAAATTINSIPYGFRGNYQNGYPSLEPGFPAATPTSPPKDGPSVRLDDILPLKADIVEDLDALNAKKKRSVPTNWD